MPHTRVPDDEEDRKVNHHLYLGHRRRHHDAMGHLLPGGALHKPNLHLPTGLAVQGAGEALLFGCYIPYMLLASTHTYFNLLSHDRFASLE